MHSQFRALFNEAYTEELYRAFYKRFDERVGPNIQFRVAETPLMMTAELRDKLAQHAVEIIEQLCEPLKLAAMKTAIPKHYDVPGMDPLPNCMQVDFALTLGEDGTMDGKVVELQAFPSLYAMMIVQAECWAEQLNKIPGLEGDWSWSIKRDHVSALQLLSNTIVANEDPEHVALVDLKPPLQKTRPDFVATKTFFGVDELCVTDIVKKGKDLFREKDGRLVPLKRIYNRMVFDELEAKKAVMPFDWNEELNVTWCSHPNWYWVWSKFSLPYVNHASVPKTWFLNDIPEIPEDLSRYVMKPLFSFAGAGVVIDVTRDHIDAVPREQRLQWVLQEKIDYAPAITMPDGNGVKAEVRVMLVRPPEAERLEPIICLVRLSRGKMIGVDHNKGLSWVGGSVGIWQR